MYGWFDLNHFSSAGSELKGYPVIRWSVGSVEALPRNTSSPSISLGPNRWGHIFLVHSKLLNLNAYINDSKQAVCFPTILR